MNIKRNIPGIGKRAVAVAMALVMVAGICAFAPSPTGNSKLRLDNVRTDGAAVYAPKNDKLARGSWFVEMVLPVGG